MKMILHDTSALTAEELAAVAALRRTSHPDDVITGPEGKAIAWAEPPRKVIWWGDDGRAMAQVGVFLREAKVNGQSALIGGIGGVRTHPDARRRGLATQAIARAIEFFRHENAEFALLVCAPELRPVYEGLGWRLFPGEMIVTERGRTYPFTFAGPMTFALRSAPESGVIDLAGPPW